MNGPILHEFPITNRMRSFLRFEQLIDTTQALVESRNSPIESIRSLHQLLALLQHSDIESELLLHIRSQEQELQKLSDSSPAYQKKLQKMQIMQEKQNTIKNLDDYKFPLENYATNHFLNSIKLRLGVPGGVCNFDLPQMNAWMHFSDEVKNKQLEDWLEPFLTLKNAIESALSLTRMSADFSQEIAKNGYYSKETPSQKNYQPNQKIGYSMIRIELKDSSHIYPEVSTGPRLFTLHFFEIDKLEVRSSKVQTDTPFRLACCTL